VIAEKELTFLELFLIFVYLLAASAVFSASADCITFTSVSTGLSIPSIPVTGVGGRGLPCVVGVVEVISSVSSTVSVVIAVTLGGFMAGVDVTNGADWFDCRPLASLSVSPFWQFPPSGGNCLSSECGSFCFFLSS
jgi:hypothetical protein